MSTETKRKLLDEVREAIGLRNYSIHNNGHERNRLPPAIQIPPTPLCERGVGGIFTVNAPSATRLLRANFSD